MFKSKVTGRARMVEQFYSIIGRGNPGLVFVTHDIAAEDADVGQHAMANLLEFKDVAREIIFVKTNGLLGYLLIKAEDGSLQDEVPAEVAADKTIPDPHGTRLQPAIGCIRCHVLEDGRGWRYARNHVRRMAGGFIDIIGDRNFKNQRDNEFVRLAGLYSGNFELETLPAARNQHAMAIMRCTGPWDSAAKNQSDIAKVAGDKLASIYAYNYQDIYPSDILREHGLKSDEIDAVTVARAIEEAREDDLALDETEARAMLTLRRVLPPIQIAVDSAIPPEDFRIAASLKGIPIGRIDRDLTFSFVATRIAKAKR